jgi:hypothetical protein
VRRKQHRCIALPVVALSADFGKRIAEHGAVARAALLAPFAATYYLRLGLHKNTRSLRSRDNSICNCVSGFVFSEPMN